MLSFGKILIIVAVVVGVMVAYRVMSVAKKASAERARAPGPRRDGRVDAKAAELRNCPACGTYTDARCNRPNCPL
ncbi:MAG: hypothetical protein R3F55_20570 [Alphaproteobacteria bacterium]